jgi:hypothetical protein
LIMNPDCPSRVDEVHDNCHSIGWRVDPIASPGFPPCYPVTIFTWYLVC